MEVFEFLTLVVPFLFLFYLAVLMFLRPTKPALLASLLGGVVMGLINALVDIAAYYAHWWQYVFSPVKLQGATPAYLVPVLNVLGATEATLHIALPFYLTPILIYGSLGYLFIWRFWRGRLRWLSLLFLIGVPLFSIVRDILGGLYNTSYQVWGNVGAASVVTCVMWIVAFAAGFFVFWRLAPPREEGVERDESAVSVTQRTRTHAE